MRRIERPAYAPIPDEIERVGRIILDSAFSVHTALGPGLLESAYEACLAYEIQVNQLEVQRQVVLPVKYKDLTIDKGYRIDLLVENCVIVELKAAQQMLPLYKAQLITYLKLTSLRLGYLINFNTPHLKNGIHRIVV